MDARGSSTRVEIVAAIITLIVVGLLTLLLLPAVVPQPASGQVGALPVLAVQGAAALLACAVF